MLAILSKSNLSTKKFKVVLYNVTKQNGWKKIKTIQFGAKSMSDFTIHKDIERKYRYIDRHKHNENWNDPLTAGFWALHLLWSEPTIDKSIDKIENHFGIQIYYDK